MALFSSNVPRSHRKLAKYPKKDLDRAEKALRKEKLLKTPPISWVLLLITILLPWAAERFFKALDPLVALALALVPLYLAVRLKEERIIALTIEQIEKQKKSTE